MILERGFFKLQRMLTSSLLCKKVKKWLWIWLKKRAQLDSQKSTAELASNLATNLVTNLVTALSNKLPTKLLSKWTQSTDDSSSRNIYIAVASSAHRYFSFSDR